MADIQTGAGTIISIGTTAAATNQTQFEADTYVPIGGVGEIGEYGDSREIVTFTPLDAGGRIKKARGSADAGDMNLPYAFDGSDAGQTALRAAFKVVSQTADEFNFKVERNDSGGTNGTIEYFRAKVSSDRRQAVTADGIVVYQAVLAINSAFVEVAAA